MKSFLFLFILSSSSIYAQQSIDIGTIYNQLYEKFQYLQNTYNQMIATPEYKQLQAEIQRQEAEKRNVQFVMKPVATASASKKNPLQCENCDNLMQLSGDISAIIDQMPVDSTTEKERKRLTAAYYLATEEYKGYPIFNLAGDCVKIYSPVDFYYNHGEYKQENFQLTFEGDVPADRLNGFAFSADKNKSYYFFLQNGDSDNFLAKIDVLDGVEHLSLYKILKAEPTVKFEPPAGSQAPNGVAAPQGNGPKLSGQTATVINGAKDTLSGQFGVWLTDGADFLNGPIYVLSVSYDHAKQVSTATGVNLSFGSYLNSKEAKMQIVATGSTAEAQAAVSTDFTSLFLSGGISLTPNSSVNISLGASSKTPFQDPGTTTFKTTGAFTLIPVGLTLAGSLGGSTNNTQNVDFDLSLTKQVNPDFSLSSGLQVRDKNPTVWFTGSLKLK